MANGTTAVVSNIRLLVKKRYLTTLRKRLNEKLFIGRLLMSGYKCGKTILRPKTLFVGIGDFKFVMVHTTGTTLAEVKSFGIALKCDIGGT